MRVYFSQLEKEYFPIICVKKETTFGNLLYLCSVELKTTKIMEGKKTKEAALNFIKTAIKHKQEWRKELEEEFKGKDLNVVFL